MKRFGALFAVIIILLCMAAPLLTFALDTSVSAESGTPQPSPQDGGNVTITVVLPTREPEPTAVPKDPDPTPPSTTPDPLPAPTPRPGTDYPTVYPSDVYEFHDETSRRIVKTYELTDRENPAGIPRDSFGRDGWWYELSDITKKEDAYAATREQTEVVTLESTTKDTDAILRQLAPTMEYQSDDGYIGVLTLDISSISIETAGTKKSSYTMTAAREYPHLSSNDTSLIPKTITQNGVTYTLESISWQTQSVEPIDYESIPASYTAHAKYTATGSKTTVTGYTTTANYVGTVSKILTGRWVYTAQFTGKPIVSPAPAEPSPEPSIPPIADIENSGTPPEPTPMPVEPTIEPTAESTSEPTPAELLQTEGEANSNTARLALIPLSMIFTGGAVYYVMKRKVHHNAKTTHSAADAHDGSGDGNPRSGG